MKFFELLTEIIGWVKIALSPTLIGLIIGAIIYGSQQNTLGIVLGAMVCILGLMVGIIWATKIFRSKNGTIHFISRVDATPELDKEEDK